MSSILHQTLSHASLHPNNLGILSRKKSWLLNLDIAVLSDSGNIYDALFMAARAALWDTKVPRTRSVEYKARKGGSSTTTAAGKTGGSGDMDVDEDTPSGFDTRQIQNATDFELPDYWDEGEILDGRDKWPVCVTLNLVRLLPFHWRYKAMENTYNRTGSSSALPRCDITRGGCNTAQATLDVQLPHLCTPRCSGYANDGPWRNKTFLPQRAREG